MTLDHLDLISVTGRAALLNSKPARGSVTFTASDVLVDQISGQAIYPVPIVGELDATGSFTVSLPATNDPDILPIGWTYQVDVNITGSEQVAPFLLSVPFDTIGAIDLFSVVPASAGSTIYVPSPTPDDVLIFALLAGAF